MIAFTTSRDGRGVFVAADMGNQLGILCAVFRPDGLSEPLTVSICKQAGAAPALGRPQQVKRVAG